MREYAEKLAAARLDAYIAMLCSAHGVDEHGLADMIGRTHEAWDEFRKAAFGDKGAGMIFDLAHLTGVRVSWLAAVDE